MKNIIIGDGKMGGIREKTIIELGEEVSFKFDKETSMKVIENAIDKVDNVFICTPNYLNKKFTIMSLKKGKNVFCEKPPALTVDDVKDIIEIEKKSNGKLMYGFNHRHHKSIIHMKNIVDKKEYGNILWMRGRYGKSVNSDYFDTWRSDPEKSGGGILIDQGIHLLDLFLYLANDFDEIHSFLSNTFWKIKGIEDNAFLILKNNKKNITASLHSTMTQWRHIFSFEVFMERGWMVLNGLKTSSNSYGNEILTISDKSKNSSNASANEIHEYAIDTSWKEETNYFFNCIRNNEPIKNGSSKDALKVMDKINNIYKGTTKWNI